jgi:hypothetical protein
MDKYKAPLIEELFLKIPSLLNVISPLSPILFARPGPESSVIKALGLTPLQL